MSPESFERACLRAGRTTSRFSLTPLGLPGRLIIRQLLLTPAFALDIMACGVFLRLSALMASAMPGTSKSITFDMAWGVTSVGLRPVPPGCHYKG